MANRIKLEICGISCVLRTDESEEYTKELGREAEKLISSLLQSSGSVPVSAVTAALIFLDESKKKGAVLEKLESSSTSELHALRQQLKQAKERISSLEEELTRTKQEPPTGSAATHSAAKPVANSAAKKTGATKNPLREFDNIQKEGLVTFYEKNTKNTD